MPLSFAGTADSPTLTRRKSETPLCQALIARRLCHYSCLSWVGQSVPRPPRRDRVAQPPPREDQGSPMNTITCEVSIGCSRATVGVGYKARSFPPQESRVRFYGAHKETSEAEGARRTTQRCLGEALEPDAAPRDGDGVWAALEQPYGRRRERPVLLADRSRTLGTSGEGASGNRQGPDREGNRAVQTGANGGALFHHAGKGWTPAREAAHDQKRRVYHSSECSGCLRG